MSRLGIFPASGALATSIYTHLLDDDMINPKNAILISRHPDKIDQEYTAKGVITRKADYDDPSSLKDAFDDISVLVLVSYPSIEYHHRFEAHRTATSAALSSHPGVSHIFYTSLAFGGDCTPASVASVMQAHLATESYLKTLALHPPNRKPFTFTAIREGIYTESFPLYTGFFDLQNPPAEVKIPHDGSGPGIAWAKRDELGEAIARIVQAYRYAPIGQYEYLNKVMPLSGPRVLSVADILKELANLAGLKEKVKITRVTQQEFVDDPKTREILESHGPNDPATSWASTFDALRDGECAIASGELERWLGRRPEGFGDTVKMMMNVGSERIPE